MIDLSIIIVNWNTRDLLAQCLQSVYDTVQGLEFEVWVVDNASTDGSAAVLRERFPQVRVIENSENVGFARANNQAIRQSNGQYVLLLNSDTRIIDDAVLGMVRFMHAHEDVGIVGACLLSLDGYPQASYSKFPGLFSEVLSIAGLDKWFVPSFRLPSSPQSVREVDWVSGACLMIRRIVLDTVGLLDEQFFMFNEEVDLCLRAKEAGWKICHLPSARVVHVGGGSTGQTAGRILTLYGGKLRYFEKHHGGRANRILFCAMRASTSLKVFVYTLLRWLSLGRVQRDGLWRAVAARFVEVQT